MRIPFLQNRSVLLLTAAFLLCGVLHILLHGVDFADNISQLFCGMVALRWAVSVKKQVTNGRLRRAMLAVAGSLLLYLLLQIARYTLFHNNADIQRYLWYAFYIPMTALPVLCLYIALLVHRAEGKRLPPAFFPLAAAAVLLTVGVLTNDLHNWFKSFPGGLDAADNRAMNGWLYYVISIFTYGSFFAAFGIMLIKSRLHRGQKNRWLPAVPIVIGCAYFLLFPLELDISVLGFRIWNIGEILVFCTISALEACIHVGMIPANTGYEELFSLSDLPAAIMDSSGALRYATASWESPSGGDGNIQLMQHAIPGGHIEWAVDIGPLRALNRELFDAAQQIDARNEYLTEEARIKAEKSELETRNRIYDDITRIVRPQLDRITAMLDDPDAGFDESLKKIAVMSAYIKRRSNMELLAENGALPAEELYLAAAESLDYVRLCGVNAALTHSGAGTCRADMAAAAYEQMEDVLEDCLDTLTDLMVSIRVAGGGITIRMMVNTGSLTVPAGGPLPTGSGFSREVSVTKDEQDMILVFTFSEGGGTP